MTKFSTSPYPGLRAFRPDESDIFFGREEQTDCLLERLQRSHFLAVVGPSGCGKSSLVRAGMIAALESGFMADAGSRWRIAEMRPGERPMSRLARALSTSQALDPERAASPDESAFLEAALRRGPLGLTEALQETPSPARANLLLLVDQFEEIFRFREKGEPDEADAFVALLLATAEQREAPVYVVITMRSDFLGDCTLFKGLPEAINESQYLTPRLTREQCRAAIVGPARVFGGDLEPALVNRLLNDFGPDPDQLPLLQHALMRMWTRVTERVSASASGEGANETLLAIPRRHVTLAVRDYEELGGLARALSDHADEVLQELTEPQRKIAEIMFRRLTERGIGKRDTRAPARLSDVAAVAGVSPADVTVVVEAFRRPDRCFVTPPVGLPVGPGTLLDIGHESLIRQWRQLSQWVETEGRSALMYQRLKQTAQLWKAGDAALWRNPDLERHLQWERTQQPSAAWAIRYGSTEEFALAMEFLRASERAWSDECRQQQEAKLQAERRRARMHRRRLIGLGLVSISLLFIAVVLGALVLKLKKQNEETAYYKQFTVLRPLYAANTPGSADRNTLFACQLVKELERRKTSIDPLLYGDAVSLLARTLDRRNRLVNTYWNYPVSHSSQVAGNSASVVAVAYSPDGQTLVIGDTTGRLRVLNNGILNDPLALGAGAIRSLAVSLDGSKVAAGTKAGSVFIFDPRDSSTLQGVAQLEFPDGANDRSTVWSCSWNAFGDLAAGCQNGKVYVWFDLLHARLTGALLPSITLENRVNDRLVQVHAVAWNRQGTLLAIGDGHGNLRLWDRTHLAEPVRAHHDAIWNLAWSQDGRLACASWDRAISIWQMGDPTSGGTPSPLAVKSPAHDQWVRDVAWINDDKAIASVGADGMLKFWDSSDLRERASEQSPTTELWKLSCSESTKMIATANGDGAVRIYQLDPPGQESYGNHPNDVMRLACIDSSVFSFDLDGTADRFDAVSRQVDPVQISPDFREGIHTVQYQADINAFVVGYDFKPSMGKQSGGQLVVWNPQSPSSLKQCPMAEPISSISCNPKHSVVAFITHGGSLGLRTLPDLEPFSSQPDLADVRTPGTSVVRIAWSNAGDILAVALNRENDNHAEILRFHFDGKTLTAVDPKHPIQIPGLIFSLAWRANDDVIAIGTMGGAVIVYATTRTGQTEPVVGHDGVVHAVNWSQDGRLLFTGGDDGSLKVWDYEPVENKLTLVITLRQSTGAIHAIGVAPEGQGVYTGGTNPKIFFWPKSCYSIDAILSRAEKMVNRNMDKPEWMRYTEKDPDRQQHYDKTFQDLPGLFEAEAP